MMTGYMIPIGIINDFTGIVLPDRLIDDLAGGLEPWIFMTFHILGMSSFQLTNSMIFQRGRSTTNQMKDEHLNWE